MLWCYILWQTFLSLPLIASCEDVTLSVLPLITVKVEEGQIVCHCFKIDWCSNLCIIYIWWSKTCFKWLIFFKKIVFLAEPLLNPPFSVATLAARNSCTQLWRRQQWSRELCFEPRTSQRPPTQNCANLYWRHGLGSRLHPPPLPSCFPASQGHVMYLVPGKVFKSVRGKSAGIWMHDVTCSRLLHHVNTARPDAWRLQAV